MTPVAAVPATTREMPARRYGMEALSLATLAAAVVLLFLTSPRSGNFWWSDAPRHALDGVFFMDVLRDLPLTGLRQYAMDYYLQYPALTVLFYPPVFPLVEALFFAVFGVSHWTAQLTVAVFYFGAASGAYFLARRWFSNSWALAVALVFAGAPEVALWGRQVMLEIPACAFVLWSSYFFLKYLDHWNPRQLYVALALLLAAIYTKQTAGLMAGVFIVLLVTQLGSGVFRRRYLLWTGLLFAAGLIPLAILTLRLSQVNVNSVVGGSWTPLPVFSWVSFTWYARQFPAQLGWPVTVLASLFLGGSLFLRRWRQDGYPFLLLWLGIGYAFFSVIALKETRHTVLILFPMVVFAVALLRRLLPARVGAIAAVPLAALTFGSTLLVHPVPAVDGYCQAVDYVARHAPVNSVVLFSGSRDGSFTFNVRTRPDRRDLGVLRSDKLLLKVTQRRELGIAERVFTDHQIASMLNQYGVTYVVSQGNFWDDLKSMQQLQRVLRSGQFQQVASIPVSANTGHEDRRLDIYKNLEPVNQGSKRIRLDLDIIGAQVEGVLPGSPAAR